MSEWRRSWASELGYETKPIFMRLITTDNIHSIEWFLSGWHCTDRLRGFTWHRCTHKNLSNITKHFLLMFAPFSLTHFIFHLLQYDMSIKIKCPTAFKVLLILYSLQIAYLVSPPLCKIARSCRSHSHEPWSRSVCTLFQENRAPVVFSNFCWWFSIRKFSIWLFINEKWWAWTNLLPDSYTMISVAVLCTWNALLWPQKSICHLHSCKDKHSGI